MKGKTRLRPPDSQQAILEPDEYIDPADGLIHCRVCGKPKQRYGVLFGVEHYFPIPCDCQKEQAAAEKREREQEELEQHVNRLKADGLGWKELQNYRFEEAQSLDPKVLVTLKNYCSQVGKKTVPGLLIWGPPGGGKTFAAACIVNEILESCQPAIMTCFGQLLEELSGMNLQDRQKHLADIFSKSLICLDDLDLRYLTKLTIPLAVDLMNRVDHSSKPVIITTGYTLDELRHPRTDLEEKIFRIIRRNTAPVYIGGRDLTSQIEQQHLMDLQGTLQTQSM